MQTISIADILASEVESWKDTARNFASSRFLVAASEYGMNKDESEELMKIAEGIDISIIPTEDSFRLDIHYRYSPYLDIIQESMDASLTNRKDKIDVMGEVAEMIQPLFENAIEQAVSDNKTKSTKTLKIVLIPEFQMLIGGDSR